MSLESSDPTKIEPDRPDQERAHQERELLSGSLIDEKKLEKASLVEVEDLTGPEKNDPTKLKNEESNVDEEETGEDSSSEEESSSDESSSSSSSSSENEESSSDESSSSSSSSDDEEEEEDGDIGKGDEAVKLEEGEVEREKMFIDSDEEEEVVAKGPIKSKHEVEDLPPVPPVDVSLEPYHKTMPVGVISSMLGNIVIVEGSEAHSALNEDSILWISETRSPLGIVDEIFGPVKNPYYVIRFNSEEDVPKGASVGAAVSFVSEFAEHILNQKDLCKKGYDASGDNDEVEFSDDEKEAEYRRSLRQEKRGTTNVDRDSGFGKRTNLKGAGFRKDKQPPVPLPPQAAASCQQLGSQAIQLHAQASNIGWIPRTANLRPNVGPSPTMTMQTCPQAFQMGAVNPSQQLWQHGFPPRPQSTGIQGGAFPMNSIPFQQLGQQAYDPHYQQFQFNQALNMFASGLMHQILPNGGGAPWPVFVGPASGQPLPPVGTMGQRGFGQVPFDCSNVNPQGTLPSFNEQRNPQALSQGEVRPPPVHSNRGRQPYQRGRLFYGGRGQQKNG